MPRRNMDTASAFQRGQMARGRIQRVFDWNKAAHLIRVHKPLEAEAGLEEDWGWTGGTIYENGKPVKNKYTYLASTWATPILVIDGVEYECWLYKTQTQCTSSSKWPRKALDILVGKREYIA